MKRFYFVLVFVVSSAAFMIQCEQPKTVALEIVVPSSVFEQLSDYHFFKGAIKDMQPNEGLVPYQLINPSYLLHGQFNNFVYVPKGQIVPYNEEDILKFPVGTCLIKNAFFFLNDQDTSKGKRIVETQLLIHRTNGWEAYSYEWNEAQTEAKLHKDSKDIFVETNDGKSNTFVSVYPLMSQTQCKGCHAANKPLSPIGPKVSNLNSDMTYGDKKTRNQLDMWATLGILKGLKCPATSPRMPIWSDQTEDIENRALAYLDVHCAHCHADKNTLDLRYNALDSTHATLFNKCNAASIYAGKNEVYILPNHPKKSAVFYSMSAPFNHALVVDNKAGRHHVEGLQLIEQWISSMSKHQKNNVQKAQCKL